MYFSFEGRDFELRDGVIYYAGTNVAPDFTNNYWTLVRQKEQGRALTGEQD